MAEREIEKPGMTYRRNTLRSSFMKFYQIRSKGCGEMASDGRTDGRKDGQTNRRQYALPSEMNLLVHTELQHLQFKQAK